VTRTKRNWRLAAGVLLLAGASWPATAGAATDLVTVLGVGSDQNTVATVDVRAPSGQLASVPVTGLGAGEVLRGIDYRPANGMLYGVATAGALVATYTIGPTTGSATPVGSVTVPGIETATEFGMSIDPIADRIRVITNVAGDGMGPNVTNLRLDPATGARADVPIADFDLDFTGMPGASAPAVAIAHHVWPGATAATTYAITTGGDRLARLGGTNGSPSASSGVLQPIGDLGVSAGTSAGFDIDPATGTGYAVLSVNGRPRTFSVDLASGAARPTALDNRVGAADAEIGGLAIPPRPAIAFAPGAPAAGEGDAATVTLTRTGSLLLASTVRWVLRSGPTSTAAGVDAAPATGVAAFGPGQTSTTFAVPTVEDAAVEGNETMDLELVDAIGADLAAVPSVTTLTILDDDVPPPTPREPQGDDGAGTAPLGLLSLGDQAIDRSLAATISCDQACRGTLVLKLGKRTLATKRVTLAGAGRRRVTLRLSKAEVDLLLARARGPRSALLRLAGAFADADGVSRDAVAIRLG
jgi:hypothetical protein